MTFDEMKPNKAYVVKNAKGENPIDFVMRHKGENGGDDYLVVRMRKGHRAECDREKIDAELAGLDLTDEKFNITDDRSEERYQLTLSDERNAEIVADINKSRPSDTIYLTGTEDRMLVDLWINPTDERIMIPSDIFFAGTIPLLDCRLVVDESDINGITVTYRVVIFSDYKERIEQAKDYEGAGVLVGALIPENFAPYYYYYPLVVAHEMNSLASAGIGWINGKRMLVDVTKKYMAQSFVAFMETWYGIQIALLHPTVQEVFKNPKTVVEEAKPTNKHGHKPRKVRYIKKHMVPSKELELAIYGRNGKEKQRHALVWYVIGHWRELKSGRKVFVNPYWKGPLRELKRNLDERQREIVMPEV